MRPIEKIPLQQIDLSDETFSVNYLPDLHRLRTSIEEIGLIQPLLLRRKPEGYQIVCGFRRISIMKEMGESEIESRVIEEKEMEESTLFSLSLQENLTTRGLNTVEKAMAIEKLIHHFLLPSETVTRTYLPLFSLEPNEKILNTFLSLARMEEEVKTYVLKEEISRSNIRRLSVLTSEDRMAVLSLISSLKLGENRLREILTLLGEISQRERCSVRDVVRRLDIQAPLSHNDLTPSQKAEHIKKALMTLRYPKLYRLEGMFEQKKRNLNLPSNLSLHHSPFFEGRELRIEFQFETIEEYQKVLSTLSQLLNKEEFKELIKSQSLRTNIEFQNPNAK
ncbi:MAG: ParB N-terminal domain-containing protein, partial [Syntrophaceae bacterium]|nr:ParB N-terminal domain-containing protein [Syntrophaceae bacterium]